MTHLGKLVGLVLRLLSIALLSVLLFFPIYIVLQPVVGPNWAAGIAVLFLYVVLPVFFLLLFPKEWTHPLIKLGNYLIAIGVIWVSFYFLYRSFSGGEKGVDAIRFFWVYGTAALYYLAFGRMKGSEPERDET